MIMCTALEDIDTRNYIMFWHENCEIKFEQCYTLAKIQQLLLYYHMRGMLCCIEKEKVMARLPLVLTKRQCQIMNLILAGQSTKRIAYDLNISRRTVENHRYKIMSRLGVRSLAMLGAVANDL